VDLDPAEYVRQDPELIRPADIEEVVADPWKARERLGWEARTGFDELIELMLEADLSRLRDGPGS
jgi:GDPmannose 4,6-dehydratase